MFTRLFRTVAGGFLMGSADLVPGVSGGTIALILGIYERLIASIREASSSLGRLLRADVPAARSHFSRVEWGFVFALLAGIGVAIITLSSLIDRLLEEQPILMSAAFFGLVIGSVVIAWRLIEIPGTSSYAIAGIVGVGLFAVLGLRSATNVVDPGLVVFFGSGALAICAMILPGISGSLILVLLGMYEPVLEAVNDRDFASLGVFILGAIVGLAVFSQVLHWALARHHDRVLAALIGLMAGSLRILWPWPDGVDSSALDAPGAQTVGAIVLAAAGFAAVFAIARLGDVKSNG